MALVRAVDSLKHPARAREALWLVTAMSPLDKCVKLAGLEEARVAKRGQYFMCDLGNYITDG